MGILPSLKITSVLTALVFHTLLSFPLFSIAQSRENKLLEQRRKITELLSQSDFAGEKPPTFLADGKLKTYDPVLLSVVATLRSRLPEAPGAWKVSHLIASSSNELSSCQGPFLYRYRRSLSGSPFTFVILPGSFATMKRGSFLNQTTAALDRKFGDPNIVAFDGFLSPAFLTGRCREIPWDGAKLAHDLLVRLASELPLTFKSFDPRHSGLIGYSGGAMLISAMLGYDGSRPRPTFGLGGIAFSPILHGSTTFHLLDRKFAQSKIDPELGLTTLDAENLAQMAKNHGPPQWDEIEGLYLKNPSNFLQRAFNEFSSVDLRAAVTATASNPWLSSLNFKAVNELRERKDMAKRPGYFDAFAKDGFGLGRNLSAAELEQEFDRVTDVRPLHRQVRAPLLIYFSQDDPILSNADRPEQPAAITQILKEAEKNPAITVFNPIYGGHTGAGLDHIFDDLVGTFFDQP